MKIKKEHMIVKTMNLYVLSCVCAHQMKNTMRYISKSCCLSKYGMCFWPSQSDYSKCYVKY